MEQQSQNQMTNAALSQSSTAIEIDLVELGYEILDKLKYVILAAIVGILIAGVYTFQFAVPQYQAVSKLYILNSNDSVVNLSDLQLGNYLASDYTEMFKTWEVKEMVRRNLNLSYSYNQLDSMVKVSNPSNTRILYITATSADPQEAVDLANEYATVISDYVARIMATERPNMLSEAILPEHPISPSKARNLILGMMVGLMLSVGLVVVRFVLNDSIKSVEDVEKYIGLPVLGIVPTINTRAIKRNRGGVQ